MFCVVGHCWGGIVAQRLASMAATPFASASSLQGCHSTDDVYVYLRALAGGCLELSYHTVSGDSSFPLEAVEALRAVGAEVTVWQGTQSGGDFKRHAAMSKATSQLLASVVAQFAKLDLGSHVLAPALCMEHPPDAGLRLPPAPQAELDELRHELREAQRDLQQAQRDNDAGVAASPAEDLAPVLAENRSLNASRDELQSALNAARLRSEDLTQRIGMHGHDLHLAQVATASADAQARQTTERCCQLQEMVSTIRMEHDEQVRKVEETHARGNESRIAANSKLHERNAQLDAELQLLSEQKQAAPIQGDADLGRELRAELRISSRRQDQLQVELHELQLLHSSLQDRNLQLEEELQENSRQREDASAHLANELQEEHHRSARLRGGIGSANRELAAIRETLPAESMPATFAELERLELSCQDHDERAQSFESILQQERQVHAIEAAQLLEDVQAAQAGSDAALASVQSLQAQLQRERQQHTAERARLLGRAAEAEGGDVSGPPRQRHAEEVRRLERLCSERVERVQSLETQLREERWQRSAELIRLRGEARVTHAGEEPPMRVQGPRVTEEVHMIYGVPTKYAEGELSRSRRGEGEESPPSGGLPGGYGAEATWSQQGELPAVDAKILSRRLIGRHRAR